MADNEAVWLYTEERVTLVQLAQASGLDEALLRELIDYGALAPREPGSAELCFSGACVARVRHGARLAADLELDTPALALVLRFLERIESLESQVRHLAAQVGAPRRG